VSTEDAKACDGCARSGCPRVVCADGRELCLACVEAAGEAAAGVDREAIEMLRWLTSLAEAEPKS